MRNNNRVVATYEAHISSRSGSTLAKTHAFNSIIVAVVVRPMDSLVKETTCFTAKKRRKKSTYWYVKTHKNQWHTRKFQTVGYKVGRSDRLTSFSAIGVTFFVSPKKALPRLGIQTASNPSKRVERKKKAEEKKVIKNSS